VNSINSTSLNITPINKKDKKKKTVAAGKTLAVPDDTKLPDGLDKVAWAEWRQHLKEKKTKPTPSALKKQIKLLLENKDDQAAIINKSISNNWQGLFKINGVKKTGMTREEALAKC
jgi:hypothetical protein